MKGSIGALGVFAALALALPACGSDDESARGGGAGSGGAAGSAGALGGGGNQGCELSGEHPLPRGETMGVLDPKRQRLVFFGGDTGVAVNCNPAPKPVGELWTYDIACRDFAQVQGAAGPSPRARGSAIYDPDGDRMIIFGGRHREASSGPYTIFNDVWALDLETLTWQELATTGTPPSPRSSAAAVHDPLAKRMLVFGGNESANGAAFLPKNDTWALDLTTGAWTEIVAVGAAPVPRQFHSAALDPATGKLYVHGGGDANAFLGPFLADLWSLDPATGTWTQEHPGGSDAPADRIHGGLFFDAPRSRVILFAGHDGAVGTQPGNQNDTWAFDPAAKTWTNITPPETVVTPPPQFCLFPPDFTTPNMNAPDRRSAYLGAQDPTTSRLFVYGGKTDCGIIDDVWFFDLAANTWTREYESTIGETCIRGDYPEQCATLCI